MSKGFYQLASWTRFFNTGYWLSVIPYDKVWDKWLAENVSTVRPVYWPEPGGEHPEREHRLVWIGEHLVWVDNDPGAFGICVVWENNDIRVISGRCSRKTKQLLRRELRHIEKSLDMCDAQARLQGNDSDDLLSIS